MRALIKLGSEKFVMCPAPESELAKNAEALRAFAQEKYPDATVEILDASDPRALPAADRSAIENAACDAIIARALQGKSASMLREAIYLQSLIAQGQTLNEDQKTEVEMFAAVNEWESDMIAAREDRIAGKDTAWPTQPTGLSDFLKGF